MHDWPDARPISSPQSCMCTGRLMHNPAGHKSRGPRYSLSEKRKLGFKVGVFLSPSKETKMVVSLKSWLSQWFPSSQEWSPSPVGLGEARLGLDQPGVLHSAKPGERGRRGLEVLHCASAGGWWCLGGVLGGYSPPRIHLSAPQLTLPVPPPTCGGTVLVA